MLSRLFQDAFNFIFPKTCHVCGAVLGDGEEYLCPLCLATIPRTGYHSTKNNRFEERFAGVFPFEKGASLFFYEKSSPLADLVVEFKYKGYSGLAREMGRIMARELQPTGFLDGIEVIVPVGMPLWRRWKRGYNQAEELATGIADILGRKTVPVIDCLRARRYHSSQTRRSATDRRDSMRGMFTVKPKYGPGGPNARGLSQRTTLLVDDVCTTGSTMLAAAEALHAAHPDIRLRLLTLASTT